MALILLSRKGVIQGDPLIMALYGIALLPLAESLREQSNDVMQPWYVDDTAMQGAADEVADTMVSLIKSGPQFGYHLEPKKSVVICLLAGQADEKLAFEAKGLANLQYVRGH